MSVLQTDLYQLTMAAGYFHRGMAHATATCELFVRRLPATRRFLVAGGIEQALDYLAGLRFTRDEIDYLRTVPALRDAMSDDFVRYLERFRFSGEVWTVAEGTPFFASEPIVRVRAPVIEAQLCETYLLSLVNHASMMASKAARVVHAAAGRQVLEFGTRRTHPDAAVDAARAAYLVGAVGTSNVEAGKRFGIPVLGTAAHMWTMMHENEEQAFAHYVATFPNAAILLIDTYDTVRGAERAARVAGDKLKGVRLDSGDLAALSREVRALLDSRGCGHTRIVASGDLNEYKISALLGAGAPIDVFGVGTELVCSTDAPSLGGVYKLVAVERDGRALPIAKFSEGKATLPGAHQLFRRREGREPVEDVIALDDEQPPEGSEPLLALRMRGGERVGPAAQLDALRPRAMAEIASLSEWLHELEPTERRYPVTTSVRLTALVEAVKKQVLEERPA